MRLKRTKCACLVYKRTKVKIEMLNFNIHIRRLYMSNKSREKCEEVVP